MNYESNKVSQNLTNIPQKGYFICMHLQKSIALSLIVTFLASLLPPLSYAQEPSRVKKRLRLH
ncbi:MAG: hypothetical protein ACMG6E_07875, partial [Candidatus Roizmanbacteria bacterium]